MNIVIRFAVLFVFPSKERILYLVYTVRVPMLYKLKVFFTSNKRILLVKVLNVVRSEM